MPRGTDQHPPDQVPRRPHARNAPCAAPPIGIGPGREAPASPGPLFTRGLIALAGLILWGVFLAGYILITQPRKGTPPPPPSWGDSAADNPATGLTRPGFDTQEAYPHSAAHPYGDPEESLRIHLDGSSQSAE